VRRVADNHVAPPALLADTPIPVAPSSVPLSDTGQRINRLSKLPSCLDGPPRRRESTSVFALGPFGMEAFGQRSVVSRTGFFTSGLRSFPDERHQGLFDLMRFAHDGAENDDSRFRPRVRESRCEPRRCSPLMIPGGSEVESTNSLTVLARYLGQSRSTRSIRSSDRRGPRSRPRTVLRARLSLAVECLPDGDAKPHKRQVQTQVHT
jgi:hypothetical protein